jgi:hypothetical protein
MHSEVSKFALLYAARIATAVTDGKPGTCATRVTFYATRMTRPKIVAEENIASLDLYSII